MTGSSCNGGPVSAETRIVMVGKTGNGKSASGNSILGQQLFQSKCSARSLTVTCSKHTAVVESTPVSVIDTPGLFDNRFGEERTAKDLGQCISYACPGPHIFLVVIAVGRFTQEEKQSVQKIQEIFGAAADKYSMVLFTHGDQLDGSIEEFLGESPDLQELVSRCNGQFHVFNNKLADKKPQVRELLQKIKAIVQKNGGSHYTNQMFQEAERAAQLEKQRVQREKEEQIRREREEVERRVQQEHQRQMQIIQAQHAAERERQRQRMEEERRRMEEVQRLQREEEARSRQREMEALQRRMEEQRRIQREWEEAERRRAEQKAQRLLEDMRRRLEEERRRELERQQALLSLQSQQSYRAVQHHSNGCTIS